MNYKRIYELSTEDVDKIIHLHLNGFSNEFISNRYNIKLEDLIKIF